MKISILGTRGIPASYGGFETCAEELAIRLARRGHKITVYCRGSVITPESSSYEGVKLVYLPSIRLRSMETISHTFLSMLHSIGRSDLLIFFNVATSPISLIARMLGRRVVLNVDGLEWKRKKWGPLGRRYYLFSARLARYAGDVLIADSRAIQKFYLERLRTRTHFIPYGARVEESLHPEVLQDLRLKKGSYILTVTRLEPENNTDLLIEAYRSLQTDKILVIVGGAGYPSRYTRRLRSLAQEDVRFLGPIYDKRILREIWTNCFLYYHGNEVGGTNPALLQAMAYGKAVLALNVPFNNEVLGDAGLFFEKDPNDLRAKLLTLLENPDLVRDLGLRARRRVLDAYDWEKVADAYEKVCERLVRRQRVVKGKRRLEEDLRSQ